MSPMKSEDAIGAKGRPFTGAEYLASLRDGREVYVYGERVGDVTTHPAFRNGARSIARLYDALHDPKSKGLLTAPTDTGSGGFTHKFFRVARSREEVDDTYRRCVEAGARVHFSPEDDRDIPGYYELFFFDPDGFRIELVHQDLDVLAREAGEAVAAQEGARWQ